jgi:hypothetical protein
MTRSSVPTSDPATRSRRRLRTVLAGLLAAGMTIAGLALAAPANAKTGFPDIELVSVSDCVTYFGSGEVTFSAADLVLFDVVTLSTAAEVPVQQWPFDGVDDGGATIPLAPGSYVLRLSETDLGLLEEIPFTIGACPDLDVALADPICSTGDDGTITLVLSGLVVGESFQWSAGGFSGSFVAEAETLEIPLASGAPPGNYIAYAETSDESVMFDWRAYAIEPCQPQATAALTQCTVAGGTGAVDVALTDLVHGVVYTVTGPDGSTQNAVADPSGVTNLTFPSIVPGTSSTVVVSSSWTVDAPYEEPPFIGGGDFVPLDTVVLTASADTTLEPCPAAVTPAAGAAPAALAESGTDDPGSPLAAAIAMLAVGGLVLAASRRRSAVRR